MNADRSVQSILVAGAAVNDLRSLSEVQAAVCRRVKSFVRERLHQSIGVRNHDFARQTKTLA
jgi:hypothetical protein